MQRFFILLAFLLSACAEMQTVSPGRGVEKEVGPISTVYPTGEGPLEARHGIWQGINGDQVVWEVRYVRGLPAGPYRHFDKNGVLVATWPYNWEGEIEGWVRFYRWDAPGELFEKFEWNDDFPALEFDPIGNPQDVLRWWKQLQQGRVDET